MIDEIFLEILDIPVDEMELADVVVTGPILEADQQSPASPWVASGDGKDGGLGGKFVAAELTGRLGAVREGHAGD